MALIQLSFTTLQVGPIATNCYIFNDGDDVAVIDPGAPEKIILEEISKRSTNPRLKILLTHCHADHFAGVQMIMDQYPSAELYANEKDIILLSNANYNCARMLGLNIVLPDNYIQKINKVSEDVNINVGKYVLNVIFTPGHTLGGTCFYCKDALVLFSGDTLFNRGRGRTDFYGGNIETLITSIKTKLFTLPDDVKVYPGHGSSTKIGLEKYIQGL